MHDLIELDNIPPHRPRPIRYSLTQIGLCFGASLAVHAAVVGGMMLSPVSPGFARATSASSAIHSDRHVVQVTFMMNASSFVSEPVKEPQEPPPITPVAVPEIEAVSEAEPTAPPPSAAKPPVPDEPIVQEPTVEPGPQPIALDLPSTERSDAPLPPVVEASEPESTEPIKPSEKPAEVIESTTQAPTEEPAQPATIDTPTEPIEPATQMEQTAEVTDAPAPPEPATEPTEPTETSTDASPAAPPPSPAEQPEDEQPFAAIYDEDSVDEPIAFDKMARPKRSNVSKRLGERGTVRIRIEVDASGNLIRHEVIDDAGHARLLKAALAALKDSTFLPAQREGQPVHSTRIIEYRF